MDKPEDKGLVTCVMITGKSPTHEYLARRSIESFQRQTYPNRELLIVNDGRAPIESPDPQIREAFFGRPAGADPSIPVAKLSLGGLRNEALNRARGDWICQWDDDDWHDPRFLETMLRFAVPDRCVLLHSQVRYSFVNDAAYVSLRPEEGHAGTILHWRTTARYEQAPKHEDTRFWKATWGPEKRILVHNVALPPDDLNPALYIRLHHGHNTWDAKHIMGPLSRPTARGRWQLAPQLAEKLADVLEGYDRSKLVF